MKKKLVLVILIIFALCINIVPAFANGFNSVKDSTVRVFVDLYVTIENQRVHVASSQGSGFAVGERNQPVSYFVTNRHVIEPLTLELPDGRIIRTDYLEYYILFDNATNKVPASLVGASDRADLAVLKLNTPTSERKASRLYPFSSLESGKKVYAVGFPDISNYWLKDEAVKQLYSTPNDMTVNSGSVSRVLDSARSIVGELIQIDVPINHGNSGGPLVDENGNILGVNTYGLTLDTSDDEKEVYIIQGMNYAVSSNEVIRFLDSEGVPYVTTSGSFALNPWLIGIIIVVLASAVVLVFIVLQVKKTKNQNHVKAANNATATRKLVGVAGPLAGNQYPVVRKVSIGRDPKKCQIAFPKDTPAVSSLHCTVRFDGTRVTVTDEGSSYGTKINEKKLEKGTPTTLHRGQKLYIGSDKNEFTLQ